MPFTPRHGVFRGNPLEVDPMTLDPIPPLTVSLIDGSSPPRWRLARGEHGVATYPTREEAESMLGKSLIAEASRLLNRVVAEACGGAWDPAKRDAWMRDWTAFQGCSADRLFSERPKGSLERVEKERDVARLTVAQWDRMHAVCKETMGGRPDEFLPMVCSRVTGERDVAVAKLAAIAEVVNRGGLEHANSCHGPDGCVCEIAEIRAIFGGAL